MSFSLIACVDSNYGLGYQNKLLAHIPNDLKRFKQLTEGKACFMGRNTFESIIDMNGEHLPNRMSFVFTNQQDYVSPVQSDDIAIVNNLDNLINMREMVKLSLDAMGRDSELMVIGGQTLYEQLLPYADTIYLTKIHHEFDNVDTFFPRFEHDLSWYVTERNKVDDSSSYDYSFITYKKV